MKSRRIRRQQLQENPYLIWNEFVDMLAISNPRKLSKKQLAAHLVFCYLSEVENGGHMQYFENRGTNQLRATIESLKLLGARRHVRVLTRAAALFKSKPRAKIESVEEYVAKALEDEFEIMDSEYWESRPSLTEVLEAYLASHQAEFILVVD